jgi:ribose/xylose/arabinose/galactoside ABC-type transport system permease subunit
MFTLLILLILLTVIISIASGGYFISISNIQKILDSMVISAMLTIGAGMLLISGQLDLSMGTVGTAAAIMFAYLLEYSKMHWIPALIFTLVTAAAVGAINATLVNVVKFPAFIATLAMASVAEGLSFLFTQGATIPLWNPTIMFIGQGKIGNVLPFSVVLLIFAFVIYGIILSKSKFGRHMYLTGGNPQATLLSGINPKKVSYILFMNSSVLAAVAGILLSARVSSINVNGIKAYQFTGLIAAILGGISFGGGTGGMGGAFVGLLIFTAFSNGMVVVGIDTYYSQIIYGLLLLLALTFDYISNKRSLKIEKKKGYEK